MNARTEIKLLQEFLKLIEQPEKTKAKFLKYTKLAMLISWLLIFYCLSDSIDLATQKYLFLFCAVVAGVLLGVSMWFLQAATQSSIIVQHLSSDSIRKRIDELKAE